MVHLDQPLFMFDNRVEYPSDGIHSKLVPVSDDGFTDRPIENLGSGNANRPIKSRIGPVSLSFS